MRFLFLLTIFIKISPNLLKQITLAHNFLILEYRRVTGEEGKFLSPDKLHSCKHLFLFIPGSIVL